MKKALMVANIKGFISFEMNDIELLRREGYEVHCAADLSQSNEKVNGLDVIWHQIDFDRNPLSKKNINAYKQLSALIDNKEFELVHCHTPIAGVITRLVCKKLQKKRKITVIYTAHGFHFFSGGPITSWILYYPIEWICSWWTDIIVTINKEDYNRAKKHFHSSSVYYIPGVGFDSKSFNEVSKYREEKRKTIGIPKDAFMLLSVGELAARKNQRVVIEALNILEQKDVYYVMVGKGPLEDEYKELIHRYNLDKRVIMLGQRSDVGELCGCADCFIHPSVREGLGIASLEGMASGLPLISADVNGIKDYTENKKTGFCVNPLDVNEIAGSIVYMYRNKKFRDKCGEYNKLVASQFDIDKVQEIMKKIYHET